MSKGKIFRRKKRYHFWIFVLLLIAGIIWQSVMIKKEEKQLLPVGSFIAVNSHDIHVYEKGKGESCFVFMTGSGTPCAYTDFYRLQEEFGKYGRTISYDHAGFGWSESTESPLDIDMVAGELKQILDDREFGNSCVLVCHSLASLEAIRFSQLYPDKVKGIIFLDCGSPEYYATLSETQSYLLNRVGAVLRVTGMNRLLGALDLYLPLVGESVRNPALIDEIREIDQTMFYRYAGSDANIDNINSINENAVMVLKGSTLGDLPILVLSSDTGEEWSLVQAELAKWSTNSSQITVKDAGHYLHWTNFEEVVKAIKEFIIVE